MPGPSLAEHPRDEEFIGRHIGPSEDEIASMLAYLGQPNLAALVDAIVPAKRASIARW